MKNLEDDSLSANKGTFFKILAENREDNRWDFKQDINMDTKAEFYELLKDILAFSNSGGGHLLLGVENGTQSLVGVEGVIDEANLGQKIQPLLGYSIHLELNYFKHNVGGEEILLGIMYIPNSNSICVSPKVFTGSKGVIIYADVVYVRRNTSSINANKEDLEELAYKISKKGTYQLNDEDKLIIERNKKYTHLKDDVYDFLKDDYRFSSLNFSYKLNDIFNNQSKYNKIDFAMVLGLDEDKIDDYFNGYALPKLEHILRATEIFELPTDYFFHSTLYHRKPLWHSPMISHCIIEKVENKQSLFFLDYGEFFRDVFLEFGRNLYRFIRWLHSDRQIRPKDQISLIFSNYDELDEFTAELSDNQLGKFKKHLTQQFYKLLEQMSTTENNGGLMKEEEFVIKLCGNDDQYVCRIINEGIKNILITSSGEMRIDYHFIDEIEHLLAVSRTYNTKEVKLEIKGQVRLQGIEGFNKL